MIVAKVGSLVTWHSAAGTILGVVEKIAEQRCADDVVRPWFYVRERRTNQIITIPCTSCVSDFEVLVENWNDERMCREYDKARELYYA